MADTLRTINIGGSILSPIAILFLYGGLVIALVNKCFALIYIVPDKVLRWIGGSTEQTDTSAVQEAKQSYEKGAGAVHKAGEGVGSGYGEKLTAQIQQAQKQGGSKADPSSLAGPAAGGANPIAGITEGAGNALGDGLPKPPGGGGGSV